VAVALSAAFSLALGTFVLTVSTNTAISAAAPPTTDDRGFIDSTARCAPPSNAVAYGYTSSSRVAICKDDTSGQFQYRGVRVSDGARLILAAKSTDRGFVAENDGITYTVTAAALVISSGSTQIRSESMVDFHGSGFYDVVGTLDVVGIDAIERGPRDHHADDSAPTPATR
jgi:hypothetical protein